MFQEVHEFHDEAMSLGAVLRQLRPEQWHEPTPFKGWTAWDVIAHLALSDQWAQATLRSREDFALENKSVNSALQEGMPLTEFTRLRFANLDGSALLGAWTTGVETLCNQFESIEPQQRFSWFGPDMAARMFITARFMETWAHGQDIYDLLRRPRIYNDSIRSIAFLGVRTFAFSFVNRGLTPPAEIPYVCLTAPSGAVWEFAPFSDSNKVEGSASDFCHVVTQNRNVLDTTLKITGDVSRSWMTIAQCFAGNPEDPPIPGLRGVG